MVRKLSLQEQAERDEAIAKLREFCPVGSTICAVLRSVSKSGMSRRIDFFTHATDHNGNQYLQFLSGWIGRALDMKRGNKEGLIVHGCGMDMGFHVVYELGRTLYPNGFDLPAGARGRNGDTSGRDSDGGYALKDSWL